MSGILVVIIASNVVTQSTRRHVILYNNRTVESATFHVMTEFNEIDFGQFPNLGWVTQTAGKLMCRLGGSIMYETPNYGEGSGHWMYSVWRNTTACGTVHPSHPLLSIRFPGLEDQSIPTFNTFTNTNFRGEMITFTEDQSDISGLNFNSFYMTGYPSWTVYSNPGYQGYAGCFTYDRANSDTNIHFPGGVGSFKQGCNSKEIQSGNNFEFVYSTIP